MPAYNSPAIVVDAANETRSAGGGVETPFTFDLNGKLYVVYFFVGTLFDKVGVYRSSDGGLTWDLPDISNAPHVGNGNVSCTSFGDVIYYSHCDNTASNDWLIGRFDTSADTYLPEISTGLNFFADLALQMWLQADSTGSLYMFYSLANQSGATTIGFSVWYNKIVGVTVGGAVLVSDSHPPSVSSGLQALAVDETDRVHVCFAVQAYGGAGSRAFYWTSISPVDGSIAAEVLLKDLTAPFNAYMSTTPAVFLGKLIFFARTEVGTLVTFTGSTGTATPTFTEVDLGYTCVSAEDFGSWPDTRPVVYDSTLYLLYIHYEGDPFLSDPSVDRIDYITSTDGITWSTPAVWYDEIAEPVNPGQFAQALTVLNALVRSNGDFVIVSTAYFGFGSGAGIAMVAPIPETPPVEEIVLNYCY